MQTNLFHRRLLEARVAKGMSQTDLAVAAGIAPGQVSRYEQGENMPRPHIMAKLASALSVNSLWLRGQSDQSTTPGADAIPKPDGGAVISFNPGPELAARFEQVAAEKGIPPDELLVRIVQQWVTGTPDLISAEEMDKMDVIMKRLARLEKASGIDPATTPESNS